MAAAIISGLVAKGFSKESITVSEPWDVNRKKMADLGVQTTDNNISNINQSGGGNTATVSQGN